jgi:hypothetical protein
MGTVVDQDHGQAVDADAVHHRRDGVLVIENGNDDARGEHAIDHALIYATRNQLVAAV